jgi:hypothetical protein
VRRRRHRSRRRNRRRSCPAVAGEGVDLGDLGVAGTRGAAHRRIEHVVDAARQERRDVGRQRAGVALSMTSIASAMRASLTSRAAARSAPGGLLKAAAGIGTLAVTAL